MLVCSVLVTFLITVMKEKQKLGINNLSKKELTLLHSFNGREGVAVGLAPAFGIRSLYQGLITSPDLEAKTSNQPGPAVTLEPPLCIYQHASKTKKCCGTSQIKITS